MVLTFAATCPVVKVGRMAGQFAKPRSAPTETRDGVKLPSYRGDIVNGLDFTPKHASPTHAANHAPTRSRRATLNLLRALAQGGFADLHRVQQWNLDFRAPAPRRALPRSRRPISETLAFIRACGLTPPPARRCGKCNSTPRTRHCCWAASRR